MEFSLLLIFKSKLKKRKKKNTRDVGRRKVTPNSQLLSKQTHEAEWRAHESEK